MARSEHRPARTSLNVAAALLLGLSLAGGCRRDPPPKQYAMTGQIIAVHPDRQSLTIKHEDIPGFMVAMTMTYPVERPELMKDRAPGETIAATLEVMEAQGRITALTHTGSAPLPANSNAVALAEGILAVGDAVPDVALIDQQDRRRSVSEWKGELMLITFIYTSCPIPNYCPLMDQNFATIQRAAAEDPALRGHVRLVSVSFDPEHDTPAVLAAHAARRKADPGVWTFLTGDPVTVGRFAARFGVGVIRDDPTQIMHNLRTALISRDGRILKIYSGNDWTPGAALADLRAALTAS